MIKQILTSALFVVVSGETAFAAEGSANGTWGIAFWVFIGYCALIIIPQAFRAFKFLLNPGERRITTMELKSPVLPAIPHGNKSIDTEKEG